MNKLTKENIQKLSKTINLGDDEITTKWLNSHPDEENYINGYNQALKDVINLLNK